MHRVFKAVLQGREDIDAVQCDEDNVKASVAPADVRSVAPAAGTYEEAVMELGAFSISLAVKDLGASRQFYEKLGFTQFAGEPSENWLIMKNGEAVIGLFQGMFEQNILTFNPGWDQDARPLTSFTDIRELQRQLRALGVQFANEADERTTGPASFVVTDPDGNPILVDQHV